MLCGRNQLFCEGALWGFNFFCIYIFSSSAKGIKSLAPASQVPTFMPPPPLNCAPFIKLAHYSEAQAGRRRGSEKNINTGKQNCTEKKKKKELWIG